MKTNTGINVPKIFDLEICYIRCAVIASRNAIRIVTEMICSLDKSSNTEYFIDRIKALCPQGAKKLLVLFKIKFAGCG